MTSTADSPLPNDVATLQTMLLSERAARMAAESEAKFRALLIEKLKYTIAKLRHDKFGQSSERGAILEQLELSLADLEEDASAAATAAQMAAHRRRSKCAVLSGASQRAGHCPSICRASASYIRHLRAVRAAAACCTRSAKT